MVKSACRPRGRIRASRLSRKASNRHSQSWNSKTSQSDSNKERDQLRLATLQAATAYELSPCDSTTGRIDRGDDRLYRRGAEIAGCRSGSCSGDGGKKTRPRGGASPPADKRVHEALEKAVERVASAATISRSIRDWAIVERRSVRRAGGVPCRPAGATSHDEGNPFSRGRIGSTNIATPLFPAQPPVGAAGADRQCGNPARRSAVGGWRAIRARAQEHSQVGAGSLDQPWSSFAPRRAATVSWLRSTTTTGNVMRSSSATEMSTGRPAGATSPRSGQRPTTIELSGSCARPTAAAI